jgi:hypothetical protein
MRYAIVRDGEITGFTALALPSALPIPPGWDGNPERLEYRNGEIVVLSEEEYKAKKEQQLREDLKQKLLELERKRLQKVIETYKYIDFADVQYYASQDDEEAKGILSWYSAYDDAIWEEIGFLSDKTFEELQNYNPVEVERRIFEQTKDKLPPLED